jgi:hypothetical protein
MFSLHLNKLFQLLISATPLRGSSFCCGLSTGLEGKACNLNLTRLDRKAQYAPKTQKRRGSGWSRAASLVQWTGLPDYSAYPRVSGTTTVRASSELAGFETLIS